MKLMKISCLGMLSSLGGKGELCVHVGGRGPGREEDDHCSGFLNLIRRDLLLDDYNSVGSLSHIFPPNYSFLLKYTKVPIYLFI